MPNPTRPPKLFTLALAAVLLANVAPARALDLGGLLTGALRSGAVSTQDMIGAIRSVSQITYGQTPSGAAVPQDAEGRVVLYKTAWCGFCKQAAAHMQQKAIPYLERDIETDPGAKAEYTRLGGQGPVPFIVFGQKTMQGFSPAEFERHYADYQRTQLARPNAPPQPGDPLAGKIPGVPVYRQPSKTAEQLPPLAKTDQAIYMGEERDGLYRVTTQQGEGWVDKLLVKKP